MDEECGWLRKIFLKKVGVGCKVNLDTGAGGRGKITTIEMK